MTNASQQLKRLDFVAKKEDYDLREAARRIVAIGDAGRNEETPADAEASTRASAPPEWREDPQEAHRGKNTPPRNRSLTFQLALDELREVLS